MGFWVEFGGWVRALNPKAYITGEIWWEDYGQNRFRNARPWLDQAFDGVMNYRFGDAVFQFLNQSRSIGPTGFAELLAWQHQDYGYGRCLALQNLFGSHDTARIGSAVVNRDLRQDHGASVQEHPDYNTRAPDLAAKQRWRQMVALQFLCPGAPYLYYGDEVGMWGGDDPDCRKPMVWKDLNYEPERRSYSGEWHLPDAVQVDDDLYTYYRTWIRRRNGQPVLRRGDYRAVVTADTTGLFAFRRELGGATVIGVFNLGDAPIRVPVSRLGISEPRGWRLDFGRRRAELEVDIPAHGHRCLGFGLE